jgi:DNA-binding transcriptional LysR family regulator
MRSQNTLNDIECLDQTVSTGSITAAAARLGTTASAVSRAITRLEKRLGAQLLRRSTRRISVTDIGAQYLEQARHAFALLDEAERAIQGNDVLRGRVRISVPTTWGHSRAAERVAAFTARYPEVKIELSINNRNIDLIADDFDAAVRLGELSDSGLVARPLEDAALVLVAAPSYIARHGLPDSIEALKTHRTLPFVLPSTGRVLPWPLKDHGQDIEFEADRTLVVRDDVLGCVSLALAGAGITQTYDFIVEPHIATKRLVEVLPQTRGRSRRFSLIYARHRHPSRAARALIEALLGNEH